MAPLPIEYRLLFSSMATKSWASSPFMSLKHELGAIDTARAMELTPMGSSAAASSRSIAAIEATGPRLLVGFSSLSGND